VLEDDRRACCATLAPEWRITCLQHRVAAPRVLRLVPNWVRAGVSEDGQGSETLVVGPQGAVVSPCLGHVDRHDGCDLGGEAGRTQGAPGAGVGVRDADDGVVGFDRREDAERCLADGQARCQPCVFLSIEKGTI
jgi:RNA-directed DNA polymerase